jgi:hypothetical protein
VRGWSLLAKRFCESRLVEIAPAFACRPWLTPCFAHRLGLNLADYILQRHALARDLSFRERRVDAAQLRHERSSGTLIKGAPGLSGVIAKPLYGASNEWMIICHYLELYTRLPKLALQR